MPFFLSKQDLAFPCGDLADEHGIVAIGGDLRPERLLAAYSSGIFPWPHEGFSLLWFCPDPRFVLLPKGLRINRSLQKALLSSKLIIKADTNFLAVIKACRASARPGQDSTWILEDMIEGYLGLFEQGYAHSIEAYDGSELVGGLYGLSIGSVFFGESMFFRQSYASKICLVNLAAHLISWDFSLIDCQAHTHHLGDLGAHFMKRKDFLRHLRQSHLAPTRLGPWQFSLTPQQAFAICRTNYKPD